MIAKIFWVIVGIFTIIGAIAAVIQALRSKGGKRSESYFDIKIGFFKFLVVVCVILFLIFFCCLVMIWVVKGTAIAIFFLIIIAPVVIKGVYYIFAFIIFVALIFAVVVYLTKKEKAI